MSGKSYNDMCLPMSCRRSVRDLVGIPSHLTIRHHPTVIQPREPMLLLTVLHVSPRTTLLQLMVHVYRTCYVFTRVCDSVNGRGVVV